MKVTKHAMDRFTQRNVTAQEAVECVRDGIRMVNRHNPERFTFKHKTANLFIVTDKAMTTVITMFRKEI